VRVAGNIVVIVIIAFQYCLKLRRIKMLIEVTQKDIDMGTPLDPRFCPIALSLKRNTLFKYAKVSEEIELYNNPRISHRTVKRLKITSKARTFMKAFDNRRYVKPFSFIAEEL
jgi:hypothetical protein